LIFFKTQKSTRVVLNMKRERVLCSEKTGIYGVKLGQDSKFGYHAIAMASDPTKGGSFQQSALHGVPFLKGDQAQGGRYNWTFRTTSKEIPSPFRLECSKVVEVGANAWIMLWNDLFSSEENERIQACAAETIAQHGVADKTKVFGVEHENKGRMVVDMANEQGFEYHYAGKTVTGIEWPALIRELVLPRIAALFGVDANTIWAHLVYYPTPECKLGWHDDGEDGINPHFILSLTYLEHPEKPRTFQVKLKKTKV
jgi:hypothetical protein